MDLLKFCKDLYPIYRSITGRGVVKSLEYIKKYIPIEIKKVKSGTKVFDWTVPPEWNVSDAFVIDLKTNKKVIDFKKHNLHLVGYSCPVNEIMTFNELRERIHYLKDKPNAIPYITSYYSSNWGFCVSYDDFKKLNTESNYKVVIKSSFNSNGFLNYGELLIKGKSKKEIFISSYICHPQMVNNELSGPAVLTGLASKIMNRNNFYSYRFILVPETIGSIVYLSQNLKKLKKNVIGGYNITCVGDEREWGIMPSRVGNNMSDKIARLILKNENINYIEHSWLDRGSDERQYCAPGIDLPISSITRSIYGSYPEYHTSLDNFELVTKNGLESSLEIYFKCIEAFELSRFKPMVKVLGEPQLGKRGLYPNVSNKDTFLQVRDMMNFLSFCDGNNSIIEISKLCELTLNETIKFYELFLENDLIA